MRRTLTLFAAAAFALGLAASADAAKIDKNGRCHDDKGRFAKMEVCKGAGAMMSSTPKASKAAPAPAASPTGAMASSAKADKAKPAKAQRCKNDKGKFAKCDAPGAHPA